MPLNLVLWIEVAGIFFGLPLLLMGNFVPRPKSIVMIAVCIACLFLLLRDKSFNRSRFGLNGYHNWRTLLMRFAIIACCLTLYMVLVEPRCALANLQRHPTSWMLIMITYPVLSVVPQEIIYRAFFFQRYRSLFVHEKVSIVTNAALFAFAHILFRNWIAVIGSFIAGLCWATTYLRSKSFLVVSIEHVLYGNFVFTLGLGHYFYAPDF